MFVEVVELVAPPGRILEDQRSSVRLTKVFEAEGTLIFEEFCSMESRRWRSYERTFDNVLAFLDI